MVNAYTEDLHFIIQEGRASDWLRVVDTGFLPPDDFAEPGLEIRLQNLDYQVKAIYRCSDPPVIGSNRLV